LEGVSADSSGGSLTQLQGLEVQSELADAGVHLGDREAAAGGGGGGGVGGGVAGVPDVGVVVGDAGAAGGALGAGDLAAHSEPCSTGS